MWRREMQASNTTVPNMDDPRILNGDLLREPCPPVILPGERRENDTVRNPRDVAA